MRVSELYAFVLRSSDTVVLSRLDLLGCSSSPLLPLWSDHYSCTLHPSGPECNQICGNPVRRKDGHSPPILIPKRDKRLGWVKSKAEMKAYSSCRRLKRNRCFFDRSELVRTADHASLFRSCLCDHLQPKRESNHVA